MGRFSVNIGNFGITHTNLGCMPGLSHMGLKSTQEKLERQQQCAQKVSFWENQKGNLKNMKCDTVEEIAHKLEKLHSYNDEIAAAKLQYNHEQMWHVMDEAKEMGEKIAEAAEKTKPKTEEERKKELKEEALGIEEDGGILSELTDELAEVVEELTDELAEASEELADELAEASEGLADQTAETAGALTETLNESTEAVGNMDSENSQKMYKGMRFDMQV